MVILIKEYFKLRKYEIKFHISLTDTPIFASQSRPVVIHCSHPQNHGISNI